MTNRWAPYQEHEIVPVRFEEGSLDGHLNDTDYAEHELEELLATDTPRDFTPGTIGRGGSYDVIERYRVEHRPGQPDTETGRNHGRSHGVVG